MAKAKKATKRKFVVTVEMPEGAKPKDVISDILRAFVKWETLAGNQAQPIPSALMTSKVAAVPVPKKEKSGGKK